MSLLKSKSLETYIARRLIVLSLMVIGLLTIIVLQLNWPFWAIGLAIGSALLILVNSALRFNNRIMAAYDRGLLHIEAVHMEDYNQYAKTEFEQGKVGDFHRELKALSEFLLVQKSRYDQHAFLIYQLIDQLDTPILVFNQKDKLTYANGAFDQLYEQPWQMYRHASPKLLGLAKLAGQWMFKSTDQDSENKNKQWQISQSEFVDNGEAHQLLVFTNITLALRAGQLNAWQQIIRVMGHEIRNSLTPVSSLAESLSVHLHSDRDQKALSLISERCHHLQDFVNRYSSLSQPLNLNRKNIVISQLVERLKGLFSKINLVINHSIISVWADETFLEQVLINLIKNANEAQAERIIINFSEHKNKYVIQVIDDGHGFANFENLFVPLYTTKQDGQGIGLNFCRNIIEQHAGIIKLNNNTDKGVTVIIHLPA